VIHLQCHNGVETLAFAQRGAHPVFGLDFSELNLKVARALANRTGLPIEFVEADVYDSVDAVKGREFDLVYTGRGALPYLPDLDRWARVVASLLAPGGLAYVMEFHPLLNSIGRPGSTNLDDPLNLIYPYLSGTPVMTFDTQHTYAPSRTGLLIEEGATVSHEWAHTVLDVVHSLKRAGLVIDIDMLWETEWVDWPKWDGMIEMQDEESKPVRGRGWWRRPDHHIRIPLMYTVGARKPTTIDKCNQ